METVPADTPEPRTSQKYLGDRGLIVLIAVLSAFVPLSTDLYLPALPGMSDYFHVSVNLTNLTLILFFIFFSLGMLFWGPMSDKYGRRPILIAGLLLYIAASAACAVSWDIWHLIFFRILQAVGGSAASAVATAMVKDMYEGRKRESVLALVQSMVVISPAVAPVLGAFMLPYTSWRGLFWTLGLIGVVSLAGGLLLEETIPSRYTGTMTQSMRRLGTVLKNPGFTALLIVFSLVSTATLAFIADSSYIYENGFGLSDQWYSFYFALNAIGKAARVELKKDGIHVLTVCPGYVRTGFGEHAIRGRELKQVRPGSVCGITAERVARATLRGYLKRKREVIVPWTMHLPVKFYQLFPAAVEWGMERMAG